MAESNKQPLFVKVDGYAPILQDLEAPADLRRFAVIAQEDSSVYTDGRGRFSVPIPDGWTDDSPPREFDLAVRQRRWAQQLGQNGRHHVRKGHHRAILNPTTEDTETN